MGVLAAIGGAPRNKNVPMGDEVFFQVKISVFVKEGALGICFSEGARYSLIVLVQVQEVLQELVLLFRAGGQNMRVIKGLSC